MTVIARPASTVVLMDEKSQVYLTKRPSTMKFFGGYYVFPGGAVDRSDYEFNRQLDIQIPRKDEFDLAFYIAAVRELFEEVGIFITNDTLTLQKGVQYNYRQRLIKGEISLFDMVKSENLSLNLENLIHFAHFTTPEDNPIRYDTRFFIAKLPANQMPDPYEGEVEEAIWLTPEESLEASRKGEILLPSPTKSVLKSVMNYQSK